MEQMDPMVLAASLLRRVSRKSGLTPVELARRAAVPLPGLMAAMNSEWLLPTKDCIRLCMISGLTPADVAFEGR